LKDPRHLMRFLRKEAGLTPLEIARAEGVSEKTVVTSIATVEQYRAANSSIELELAVRNLAISAVPKAQETLHGLLSAMELVEVSDPKTGKKRSVKREDKVTRLEALRIVNTLISSLQPKAPMIENNISQTNQVAHLSAAETTEDRLRRLRDKARAFNALPPEVAGVPDAIDAGGSADDEDGDEEEEEDDN
jgi:transcriptional regulator with XRE-family HTH domain